MKPSLIIEDEIKKFRSDSYNYQFNMKNGYFERWGKSFEDDPIYSPYGPEIWDAEVAEKCHGVNNKPCSFCYKSNVGHVGRNTTYHEFVRMFNKLPRYNGIPFVTQIAFGIGDVPERDHAGNWTYPLWSMMKYCRDNNVIPNVTINGDRLTDEIVENLATLCGAISVSCYDDKDVCYNAVKRLKDAGCKQVNIHQMVSQETYVNCIEKLYDYRYDNRLKDLNAIVFLSLKQKGRGESFSKLDNAKFKNIIQTALYHKIPIGFDSCGANRIMEIAKDLGKYDEWIQYAEPCESTAFSFYTSVDCKFFPCSFAEDVTTGIDMLSVNNFMVDVWENKLTCVERKRIMDNNRSCPYFEV